MRETHLGGTIYFLAFSHSEFIPQFSPEVGKGPKYNPFMICSFNLHYHLTNHVVNVLLQQNLF